MIIENFTKETFAPLLHTTFRVLYAPDEQPLEMELVEVTDPDEGKAVKPQRQECFSLLFRAPKTLLLWHAIYKFAHEQLGEFDLYIAPVDQTDEWFYYEAVFNRLIKR